MTTTNNNERRTRFARKLTTRLLINISLWSVLLVTLLSSTSFWISYQHAKEEQIEQLTERTLQRINTESLLFREIEGRANELANTFVRRYQQLSDNDRYARDFEEWYQETSPGVMRLKPHFYHGIQAGGTWFEHVSVFVGPREEPISNELKTRTVLSQHLINEFGPALHGLVTNTHISMPENILVHYAQEHPWGLLASSDLVMTDYSTIGSTLQQNNPDRTPNWTGLYYDLSADYWTITHQVPVDLDGKHLINASHDVGMNKLIVGLVEPDIEHAHHMVFNNVGALVATDETLTDFHRQRGVVKPEELDNPVYSAVYDVIHSAASNEEAATYSSQVFRNAIPGQLMLVNRVEGPDWWHVTLYPYREIQKAALSSPLILLGVSIGLVILILLVVYILISQQVSRPLHQLSDMAELIGEKKYEEVLAGDMVKQDARSEVGLLVRSFKTMARRLLEHQLTLEAKVKQRTRQLARANEKLDQMAHLDGLTGLLNRRAFDRDLEVAIQKSDNKPVALILGDLDGFKAYNDNYGHQAGDETLKNVACALKQQSGGKVYRYGGEELAILLPAKSHIDALDKTDNLRAKIEALNIPHETSECGTLTVSFGVTMLNSKQLPAAQIENADKQLYEAKASGRNQVR